jgi:ribose transport system substrate-binding protein
MSVQRSRFATVAAIVASLFTIGVAATRSQAAYPAQRQHIFYLIPGLSNNAFYRTMQGGAQQAAKSLGIKLIYQGSPYAFSPSAQIPYLDAAIAQHPDAILIAPTDKTALNTPIRRAVRAGIPIITVDTSITAPLALTNIASNNVQGGKLAATTLAQAIHLKGTVAGLSIHPGVSTTDQRQRGFAQQIQGYRNIRYLGTWYDNDIMPRAASITARLVAQHPDLNGIFAMNVVSGDGAISALQSLHHPGRVKLVEFDADPIEVQALRQRLVQALVAQDPWTIGSMAVRIADRWVTGHRTGIKKHYSTSVVVLTSSNVDNPKLRRFLYSGG